MTAYSQPGAVTAGGMKDLAGPVGTDAVAASRGTRPLGRDRVLGPAALELPNSQGARSLAAVGGQPEAAGLDRGLTRVGAEARQWQTRP